MTNRQINQKLFDLLTSGQWNDFTVTELKTAYRAQSYCMHHCEKAAWQFVYRRIARLEHEGIVSRVARQQGARTRYRLNPQTASSSVVVTDSADNPRGTPLITDSAIQRSLKEKLHRYQVEMLNVIGEAEEYEAICSELPHMRNSVQALYNDARDRCSKTMGRVRAIECVLAQAFGSSQL